MSRTDERGFHALRPVTVEVDPSPYAEGSCLISTGGTRVLCAASVEESLPAWRSGGDSGWVTAEYGMLPRATHTRSRRERTGPRGRTREIERLIGRSLRGVVDLQALGPRTVVVDCDVLQANGGTRTASITGGWIALMRACEGLVQDGVLASNPVREQVVGVSVGIVDGIALLDLDYEEDSRADVDMNIVATGSGGLIEVQGTAEGSPFSVRELDGLIQLALAGIEELAARQREALRKGGG